MPASKKRLALILSQETFDNPYNEARDGTKRDVEELQEVLELYGFQVRTYEDEKKEDILSALKSVSSETFRDHDCFMVIVLTHGSNGGVLCAKDQEFYTKDVWEPFQKSEKLKHIPKVFIFQACRGTKAELSCTQLRTNISDEEKENVQIAPMLPHQPGFLLVHSTIEDHVSKRNVESGTIFIQTLCNQMRAAYQQDAKVDFLSLLTDVNSKIVVPAERKNTSQTSTFTSFLHQPLFLKNDIDPNIGQRTSELSNDASGRLTKTYYAEEGDRLALILYAEEYKNNVDRMRQALENRRFNVEEISIDESIASKLSEMARGNKFENAGSLTVIVIAELLDDPLSEHCEILSVKTATFKVQLNKIWSQFIASQCHHLKGKPKLFFFCDLLERKDMSKRYLSQNECSSNLHHEPVNNHSDFLWVYCYGKKMYECLAIALLTSDEEVTQMLTTAMRKADSHCTSRKISHFESTLRLQYHYQRKSCTERSSVTSHEDSSPVESSTSECGPPAIDVRESLHAIVEESELEDTLDIVKTLGAGAKPSTVRNLQRKLTRTVTLLTELNLGGPDMEDVRLQRQSFVAEIEAELQKLERNRQQLEEIKVLHDPAKELDTAKTSTNNDAILKNVESKQFRSDSLMTKAIVNCPEMDEILPYPLFVAENDPQESPTDVSSTASIQDNSLRWDLKKNAAVGIDLGTTYSCVSVYKDDSITVIADENGDRLIPSVVAFQTVGGEIRRLVGREATENPELDQSHVVREVKRLIGRKFNEPAVQANLKRWAFQVTADTEGGTQVSMQFHSHGLLHFTPEDISASILGKMKSMAERHLGKEVRHAVITVPAKFNNLQRKSTMEAARLANLNVLEIINEPSAGALAYGIRSQGKKKRHILIMDVGGGTSDVALLEVQGETFTILACEGDNNLGGEDFDSNLTAHCLSHIEQGLTPDFKIGNLGYRRIRNKCEQAKVRLSENPYDPHCYYLIELEDVEKDMDFVLPITRNEFEDLNQALFQKAIGLVTSCLHVAELSPGDVSDIVPIGGSMRIPKLREMLEELFEGRQLYGYVNPDEAVSVGAAILASQKLQIYHGHIELKDVTSFSLTTSTSPDKRTYVLIPRHTRIPCQKQKRYANKYDYQSTITFDLYQGENEFVKDNVFLDNFQITDLTSGLAGETEVDVTFAIDKNGLLKVTSREVKTGKENKVTGDQHTLVPHLSLLKQM